MKLLSFENAIWSLFMVCQMVGGNIVHDYNSSYLLWKVLYLLFLLAVRRHNIVLLAHARVPGYAMERSAG